MFSADLSHADAEDAHANMCAHQPMRAARESPGDADPYARHNSDSDRPNKQRESDIDSTPQPRPSPDAKQANTERTSPGQQAQASRLSQELSQGSLKHAKPHVVALMQKRQQQSAFSTGYRTIAEATAAHAQQHDTRIVTNEAEESVNYKDNDTLSPDVNEEPTHAQHAMPMHEDNGNGAAAPEPSADAGCRDQPECATGKRKSNHNDNDAQPHDITDRERKIQCSTNVCSANKDARDDFCKQRDQCEEERHAIEGYLQSLRQERCRMYSNERNEADTAISTLSNRAEKLKHDIVVCEKRIEAFDHHLQTTQS